MKCTVIRKTHVLCPTPGRLSSASNVSGTDPPCCSTSILLRATRFLALVGARPRTRIRPSTVETGSLDMEDASGARANRAGVTSLTLTSVLCVLHKKMGGLGFIL